MKTHSSLYTVISRARYAVAVACFSLLAGCAQPSGQTTQAPTPPRLFPDYAGVTVPVGIAPLHFDVQEEGARVYATFACVPAQGIAQAEGQPAGAGQSAGSVAGQAASQSEVAFAVRGRHTVSIPTQKWHNLTAQAAGGAIRVTVSVKQPSGWTTFAPFDIFVSADSIDHYLAYRLIAPGYEVYSKMGIYQRDLRSFRQTPILENTLVQGNCMNCHSFSQHQPDQMSLHIRGELGCTLLTHGDQVEALNTKTDETFGNCVYPYWHPSGDYIVYSINKTLQVFHAIHDQRIEVVDLASDIAVYHPTTHRLLSCDLLQTDDFETFPSFSPDGRTLYFASSKQRQIPEEYQDVHYDLCAIAFHPEDGTFGDHVDTLVHASALGKSISFPRPDPTGRFILYTLSDYGNFSIWHREADLWLLDLADGTTRPADALNSPDVESYHSWSRNGRWVVVSSRRGDGLYTRPYLAHVNEDGTFAKPFLLPQQDPGTYYSQSLYSYNVPEFVEAPVTWDVPAVETLLKGKERQTVTFECL